MGIVKRTTVAAVWLVGAGVLAAEARQPELQRYHDARVQMGVLFKIVLYAPDEATANGGFEAAFSRIQQLNGLLSDYDSESELVRLSRSAPTKEGVPVSDDLWNVLSRADRLSRRTDGAFDVTVGPLTKLWRRAHRQGRMPDDERLARAKAAVGYRLMQLDCPTQSVRLTAADMRIDLGGIAKGYAADEALRTLADRGIRRAIINASGDVVAGDPPPEAQGWKIGIAPLERGAPPSRFHWLANRAVATSGDAWQYVEIDGRRYSHIVDPRTGLGLTDHSSVTVLAADCTTADGLASAVSVLGPKEGLELIEKTPGTAALILRAPDGQAEVHQSKRFDELPVAPKPE